MGEKTSRQPDRLPAPSPNSASARRPARRPSGLWLTVTLVAVFYLLWTPLSTGLWPLGCDSDVSDAGADGRADASVEEELRRLAADGSAVDGKLVPLEAHIMSKCGDAEVCLKEMVLPVMQKVYDKVNFTLSFVGTPTENDGVACMHGPDECMGNIIELCAAELYPDAKTWLGFTMCLTREYWHIPQRELVEDCALEHAVDVDALNDCASREDGAHGMDLLRRSVRRTSKAGVTNSCTVRLDNKVYCIRDNDEWKDCPHGPGVNDLAIAVEKLHRSYSHSA